MPKIFDCFPFFNELDTIEIRMQELYDHVDFFIISESNLTHSGTTKPLYFEENKSKFEQFKDKIIHLVIKDMPTSPEKDKDMNWTRERFQRNAISRKLIEICEENDLIISSDADEIVRGSIINGLNNTISSGQIYNIGMDSFSYFLNLTSHSKWYSAKAFRYSTYKNWQYNASNIRVTTTPLVAHNGGWHFGYMGGLDKVKQKLQSFAHQEFNKQQFTNLDHLRINISAGTSVWDMRNDITPCGYLPFWHFIEINEASGLPKCIINNQERYKNLIADVFFNHYIYDCGNLNHIRLLCNETLNIPNGGIIDIGCLEGRTTIQLANISKPQRVIAVDSWEELKYLDRFNRNIKSLTDGNVELFHMEARNFLQNYADPIKFIHLDANYETEFVKDCLDLALSKMVNGGIICGYDYHNDHTRKALELTFDNIESSGKLWFKRINN